jgi:CheY-like chemotaxis protein
LNAPADPQGAQRGGGQILLAVGDPAGAALAAAWLEAAGHEVTRVDDAAKAVQAAREWVFDLILLELRTPIVEGLDAIRSIRRLSGRSGLVPILGLTEGLAPGEAEACVAAGLDDLIALPIVAERLLDLTGQFLPAEGAPARVHSRSGGEADAHPDLDPTQLDNLARLVPADQLEAMVRGHLGASAALLSRMAARAEAMDLHALGLAAHECRGSWAELGARRIQHLAAELEQACREGDGAEATRRVDEIRRAVETAGALLDRYLIARRGDRRAV